MKIISPVLLGLSLAVVGSSFAAAQEMQSAAPQMQGPPKVLQITREFIKPESPAPSTTPRKVNSWRQ